MPLECKRHINKLLAREVNMPGLRTNIWVQEGHLDLEGWRISLGSGLQWLLAQLCPNLVLFPPCQHQISSGITSSHKSGKIGSKHAVLIFTCLRFLLNEQPILVEFMEGEASLAQVMFSLADVGIKDGNNLSEQIRMLLRCKFTNLRVD
jgi:hypothetical protein